MLGRFIKPRWKHSNPEVRRGAVARIDDAEILLQIANDDPDTGIREAAIARIGDLATLTRVNIAPEIEAALNRRFVALLPGAMNNPALLPAIENQITQRGGIALQREIATQSGDAAVRLWLIPHVTDPALLEEMAASDGSAEVRMQAAERINEPAAIRRTLKALGKRDKRTMRLLKQKLDALEQQQARRAEIDRLLDEIEALDEAEHWQRDSTRLMSLSNRWRQLEAEADDAQRQRFERVSTAAQTRIAARREQAEAAQPVIEAKQSQVELMADFVEHLQQRHRVSPAEAEDLQHTLDTLLADWNDLPALPEHLEVPLANRFHKLLSTARKQVAVLQENSRSGRELERIIDRAEKLLHRKRVPEAEVDALQAQWEQQKLPRDRALAEEYQSHFARLLDQLRQRLAKQQAARERGLAEIDTLLARIGENLEHDRLGDSNELERRIREILDSLIDVPGDKLETIRQRLRDYGPKIRELNGWRHWGTDRAREELIEEAQQLAQTEQTPEQRARAVADLRKRWKALVEIDHGVNHRLWKRFDKACNEAWQLCAEHRKQQAAERKQNLAAREAICAELDALRERALAESPEWREIDRAFQQLRNRWRQAGPVDRNDWRKIQKRYRAALAALDAVLQEERERNHAERMALIEQLEALADSDDLRAAMATVREAQKAWRLTVSGKRSVEQAMWKRFKAAGDAIFAREKSRIRAANETTNQLLQQKAAICEALEKLAETPEKAAQQQQALIEQWQETEMPRGRDAAAIEQRYRDALQAIDFARERAMLEKQLEQVEEICNAVQASDTAADSDSLLGDLLDLEIRLDIPSPTEFEQARMERKVAMLSERLGSRNEEADLDHGITALEQLYARLDNAAISPQAKNRLEAIREAIATELTSRIAELRQI